ncbi:hypothetical protein HanPSC8_Chr09g0360421 [Helianthus annuus]|nr:hypothetical protein HanPSC8_Chr09g0360421 [Helianthus annuus]
MPASDICFQMDDLRSAATFCKSSAVILPSQNDSRANFSSLLGPIHGYPTM